ncbi:MAG: hypothetical protein GY765_29300 [bacterium]|nr:hypothetical protein [bacterium]
MFEHIFTKVHDKNKEIKLIGVWGKDGLELEKKCFSEAIAIDLEFVGAELADIISKLELTKVAPENYSLKLGFNNYYLLVFSLTSDFFLIILADQSVILGKLKFYLDSFKKNIATLL